MEPWLQGLIVGLAGPILLFLAGFLTYRATRGKTQADMRTAQEKRMDDRMEAYTSRVEKENEEIRARLADQESKSEEQDEKLEKMQEVMRSSTHRERSLFLYLTALRNHIVKELPPPPPTIPNELVEWYEDLENTFPRSGPT